MKVVMKSSIAIKWEFLDREEPDLCHEMSSVVASVR